jgi:GGDEF domain-containing protein
MTHLRKSILNLILCLAVFYNIERLNFGQNSVVNIASFVYVLATIAVLFTVRSRKLARVSTFALIATSIGAYLVIGFFIFRKHGFWHHATIYLMISEVTFLSILVWMAHGLTRSMSDFEEAVANITLAGVSHPPQLLEESMKQVQDQMYLSRRYDRPLSVVVVECDQESVQVMLNHAVRDVQRAMMSRYVASGMVRVLDGELRRTDLVLQHKESGRFVLVCPETDAASLSSLIDRIRTAANDSLGVSVSCGIASFPDGALTFDELLNKAEHQLDETHPLKVTKVTVEENSGEKKQEVNNDNSDVQTGELQHQLAAGGQAGK